MAAKICKSCGESNGEGAMMCVSCGSSLRGAEVVGVPDAEKGGSLRKDKIRVCSNCSEHLEPGALKCKYCGTTYTSSTNAPARYSTPYNTSGSSSNGCAIVLLYVATLFIPLVGLIVGGFYALNDDPDKQSVGKGLLIFGVSILLIQILLGIILT